jgi:hypothetical protein
MSTSRSRPPCRSTQPPTMTIPSAAGGTGTSDHAARVPQGTAHSRGPQGAPMRRLGPTVRDTRTG